MRFDFSKTMKEIKEQILEWNSYLPEVKRQSIDVLVENIIDLAVANREKEIVGILGESKDGSDGDVVLDYIINIITAK
mgnify:CR=1 FL=1